MAQDLRGSAMAGLSANRGERENDEFLLRDSIFIIPSCL